MNDCIYKVEQLRRQKTAIDTKFEHVNKALERFIANELKSTLSQLCEQEITYASSMCTSFKRARQGVEGTGVKIAREDGKIQLTLGE